MNKFLSFLRKGWFSLACICAVIIFAVVNYSILVKKIDEAGVLNANLYEIGYWCAVLVFGFLLFLLSKKIKKDDNNYKWVFVGLAAVMGMFYLGLSPLFTGSDEHNHYYRIYEITEGVIKTPTGENYSGGELPSSLSKTFMVGTGDNTKIKYSDIKDMLKIPLDESEKILYSSDSYATYYSNTSLYSPISYLPHTIGFTVGKVFRAGPFIIGILGRLFNLIFYILLGYFAIKIMPKGKLFYLLILLSPNMLQCATTLSADAFTNVIFLLLFAMIMKTRFEEKIVTRKQELAIFIFSLIIALCKICYVPLVALIFLIPKTRFKNGYKEKILLSVVVLSFALICSLSWTKGTDSIFAAAYPQTALQKAYIFSHPFSYIVLFIRSIISSFVNSVECLFVGTTMYHAQLEMPAVVSMFYVGMVMISAFKKEKLQKKIELKNVEKILVGSVSFLIVALILTALYIQCTAQFVGVAYPTIVGIQGRYFIPVVFLLLYLITAKKTIKINEKKIFVLAIVISIITWLQMLCQFIV